jgi:hypothetical protein
MHPRSIKLRAFREGFMAGADPSGKRRRHAVDPITHAHWRRGFEAGQRAAFDAESAYCAELVDAERAPIKHCGEAAKRAERVPGWVCTVCGVLFRAAVSS